MDYHIWLSEYNSDKFKFYALNLFAKATCGSTHCGSSDTGKHASQNWSTKVYANKPMTIQALKEEIRYCIYKILPQLCKTVIEKFVSVKSQDKSECIVATSTLLSLIFFLHIPTSRKNSAFNSSLNTHASEMTHVISESWGYPWLLNDSTSCLWNNSVLTLSALWTYSNMISLCMIECIIL